MEFPLDVLPAAIATRGETWARLGIVWHTRPVHPNHGKPVSVSEFESVTWGGDLLIWITGEADLATIRLSDDRMVNKHYDLAGTEDLAVLLNELEALLLDDRIPTAAIVARYPGGPR